MSRAPSVWACRLRARKGTLPGTAAHLHPIGCQLLAERKDVVEHDIFAHVQMRRAKFAVQEAGGDDLDRGKWRGSRVRRLT